MKKEIDNIDNLIDVIKVLKIKKGDALVVKYPMRISEKAYTKIHFNFKEILKIMGKEDIPIVILEDGLDIEILRLSQSK